MPNLHSHAFQRAMAGLAEARTHASDSFWTWRELMYRFAARITPAQLEAIAGHLYVEMLKAGYTSVAEFHYLHHDAGGRVFADPAEMSERVIEAARGTGIALTHLPVLYAHGGFGARPATAAQSRFLHDAQSYAGLLEAIRKRHAASGGVRIGIAFHSLRAVDPAMIEALLAHRAGIDRAMPVHIHIAEQEKEVQDCLAWSGARPVQWLLDHAPVDGGWCLVHATHLSPDESRALAASSAVAGLCPTTEANLGDGLFPAAPFLDAGGRFGIGSDSHVDVAVREELRLLEYGQRLVHRRRSVLAHGDVQETGRRLYAAAARGGAQALGIDAGHIAAGARADLVVLDRSLPMLANAGDSKLLDAWIFAGDARAVRDVMVGGRWRVRERHHAREEELAQAFVRAQRELLQ
jgi:formimidoylglutamate deiminase